MLTRTCFRCKTELPLRPDFFYKDKARPHGLSYECKSCLSVRKKGRDRRKERWANLTDEQKKKRLKRQRKYNRSPKGRAIMLRKAYQNIDSCDLTVDELMSILEMPCTHCGTTAENRGLDRIDNNKPHTKDNVAPSCAPCNFARGDRFTFDEMQIIGKAIRKVLLDRPS